MKLDVNSKQWQPVLLRNVVCNWSRQRTVIHSKTLMLNPTLSDLVGGIGSVTLSDDEARRRGTQKTVLERRSPPTFDILVELQTRDKMAVHEDIAAAVDSMLRTKSHQLLKYVIVTKMAISTKKHNKLNLTHAWRISLTVHNSKCGWCVAINTLMAESSSNGSTLQDLLETFALICHR